ncbi:hypothetical protein UPYG_G00037900 [Umbra pygmaea]|uniref:BED-type domain-containing protein n=1 Tax=Umbra pygmaea TaxID=75934 RepID=A0ABD0Y4X5_UMBPY
MKMPKARRSKVWLHFTSRDAYSATCNRCLKAMSCKGGNTSNLMKHLATHRDDLKTEQCTVFDNLRDASPSTSTALPVCCLEITDDVSSRSSSGMSPGVKKTEMDSPPPEHSSRLGFTKHHQPVFSVHSECNTLEKPWRNIPWKAEMRKQLMDSVKLSKPIISSVNQVRVLLIGPVGAGKSSFFNSINSIFRGHVTGQAISGSSGTSLTTQFRTYSVKDGRDGKPLPIVLCDTMGLEETIGAGIDVDDISSILKGHVPDRYQFNPSVPLQADAHGFRQSVKLQDRIHCVAYVMDTCKVSNMSTKLEEKLSVIRRRVNLLGIPQLVVLTKVDEACPTVADNIQDIYNSLYIKAKAQEVSGRLGVPVSCIVPVKNYSEELELDMSCDILLLSALIQMLRYADNYFDEVSDQEKQE